MYKSHEADYLFFFPLQNAIQVEEEQSELIVSSKLFGLPEMC